MAQALTHYEKERADWLRDRALGVSHPDGIFRRVEQLERRVRRAERSAIGVKGEIARASGTPNALTRWIRAGGDGDAKWRVMVGYPAVGLMYLLIGPGLALGAGLYGLWYHRIGSWGRLLSWPYLLAGANVLGFGLCWALIAQPGFLALYVWAQLLVGPFRAGWLVRAWGWPAVADVHSDPDSEDVLTVELDDLEEVAPVMPGTRQDEPDEELLDVVVIDDYADEPNDDWLDTHDKEN